jgi:isopropylmalate/homocitrate/citramalate synthase
MRNCLISEYTQFGLPADMPKEVSICDVTLRDGEQTPGVAFSTEDKIEMAKLLDALGIAQIQVGFAGSSKSATEECRILCALPLNCKTEVMTRATYSRWEEDVAAAASCNPDIIHSYIPMSPHVRDMYPPALTDDETLKRAEDVVTAIKKAGNFQVNISLLDVPRCDEAFLMKMIKLLADLGCERIRLADTVGTATPEGIYYIVSKVKNFLSAYEHPPILGLHCHNDFGLALANVFAGVKAGATLIDASVNGLGDRSGNPALAEVVTGLEVLYRVKTNIKISGMFDLAKFVEKKSGIPIPTNRPLVGEYVFADELDSHVEAVLRNPFSFNAVTPQVVGNERKFILGKSSGESTLKMKLKQLGLEIPQSYIEEVIQQVRDTSAKYHGTVMPDEELIKIIHKYYPNKPLLEDHENYDNILA